MHRSWVQQATEQAGVVTGHQLLEAGLTRYQTGLLLSQGVLRRAGRGLYVGTLGNAVDPWEQRLWIAVISAGPGAVAFREAAAAWWSLDGCPPGPVEVAIPPGRQTRLRGVRRPSHLSDKHVTVHRGLPVTTVARTISDLGSTVGECVVERALESALRRKLVSISEVVSLIEATRLNGRAVVRGILARRPEGAPPTESDAETLFLQVARVCGVPEPRRQFVLIIEGRKFRIDFAWPDLRIAVEIDGAEVHSRPGALRSDLLRQNRILLDGWTILRFTWYDLVNHPQDVVVRALLSAWTMKGGLIPRAV